MADVFSICNALVDYLVKVEDRDLQELGIQKGLMHLVDAERQQKILEYLGSQHLDFELGGSAMNTSRALAGCGVKTGFFGAIGRDNNGQKIETRMKQLGITSFLNHVTIPTGVCLVLVTPEGERTMNTSLSASCEINKSQLPEKALSEAKILYFTGYQLCTPNQKETVLRAVDIAKKNNIKVALDVSDPWVCQIFEDDIRRLIKEDVDLFFSNREELKELYGKGQPEVILSEILESSPKLTAAIKLGSEGCLIGTSERIVKASARKVQVIDTTGAGDMFAAGFIASWLKARDLEACAESATTLAAEVIQHMGAKLRDEVLQDLRGRI